MERQTYRWLTYRYDPDYAYKLSTEYFRDVLECVYIRI